MNWQSIKETILISLGLKSDPNYKEEIEEPLLSSYSFSRFNNKKYSIKVGDKAKLWNKKGTTLIKLFAMGGTSGDSFIGSTDSRSLTNYLEEGGSKRVIIENISSGSIRVKLKE